MLAPGTRVRYGVVGKDSVPFHRSHWYKSDEAMVAAVKARVTGGILWINMIGDDDRTAMTARCRKSSES